MASSRFWQIVGVAGAGGAGYYLYNAGGSPKVAEKRFEADAAKVSSDIRSHLPGAGKEAQKQASLTGAEAGQKLDQAVKDAKQGLSNADGKLEAYRKDAEKGIERNLAEARQGATQAVDKFDKSVSEGAEKAKGWFGGSK